jgi:hypothetical protein
LHRIEAVPVVQVKRCRNYDGRVANSEWRVAIQPLIASQAGIQPRSPYERRNYTQRAFRHSLLPAHFV